MHNGNNDEVNESEPIVEEPKKEVNFFYGFSLDGEHKKKKFSSFFESL